MENFPLARRHQLNLCQLLFVLLYFISKKRQLLLVTAQHSELNTLQAIESKVEEINYLSILIVFEESFCSSSNSSKTKIKVQKFHCHSDNRQKLLRKKNHLKLF